MHNTVLKLFCQNNLRNLPGVYVYRTKSTESDERMNDRFSWEFTGSRPPQRKEEQQCPGPETLMTLELTPDGLA